MSGCNHLYFLTVQCQGCLALVTNCHLSCCLYETHFKCAYDSIAKGLVSNEHLQIYMLMIKVRKKKESLVFCTTKIVLLNICEIFFLTKKNSNVYFIVLWRLTFCSMVVVNLSYIIYFYGSIHRHSVQSQFKWLCTLWLLWLVLDRNELGVQCKH